MSFHNEKKCDLGNGFELVVEGDFEEMLNEEKEIIEFISIIKRQYVRIRIRKRNGSYSYNSNPIRCGIGSEFTPIQREFNLKPKKPLMDRKYPHICFQCRKPLKYKHALNKVWEKYEIYPLTILCSAFSFERREEQIKRVKKVYELKKQFRKWWKSSYMKFLCCNCIKYNQTNLMNQWEWEYENGLR